MEVTVAAPAAEVVARVSRWGTVTPLSPTSCRLEMTADDLSWPAMALGALGHEFTVQSPPELLELLSAWAALYSRAVGHRD